MKKVLSALIVLLILASAVFAFASCKNDALTIYDIANESNATRVDTVVVYKTASGDSLTGVYKVYSDKGNAIIEYEYDRFQLPEEVLAGAAPTRIVEESGKIYYYGGVYTEVAGSAPATEWVGTPADMNYKFALQEDKFTAKTISQDGTTLIGQVSAEACAEMFGFDLSANGEGVIITVEVTGDILTAVTLRATTKSGADIVVTSFYVYGEQNLDFSAVTGGAQ